MKKFLFHIHTEKSIDAIIRIDELLEYVIKNKIDHFSVTDHHTFEACKIIERLLKSKRHSSYKDKINLIKGMEITTEYGDVIPLFIKKEIKTRKFFEVVKETKKQKGLLIIPHPFHMHKNIREIIKYADGIEVYNSCATKSANEKARKLALENPSLLQFAAVDAHMKEELGNALNEIKIGKKIEVKPILCKSSGYYISNLKHFVIKALKTIILKINYGSNKYANGEKRINS
jgi:predicted metal-dependent phosphoesterase TrpH